MNKWYKNDQGDVSSDGVYGSHLSVSDRQEIFFFSMGKKVYCRCMGGACEICCYYSVSTPFEFLPRICTVASVLPKVKKQKKTRELVDNERTIAM